ncbi:hypothetical protein [Tabrizicola fusiformis]|uniref:hypothetical protein n=1 Tax=Tabrizicola sp. SY72 TaxID=2741673 RepID=UPI001572A698|nr:hypothetical protein [Tabrizicola sp. SY72]NTT88520.1 hypothetical protein [Tabrizicola sp. SY72]
MGEFSLPALIEKARVYVIYIGDTPVNLGDLIERMDRDLTATDERVGQLQVLLARNLVFDLGSAEDALEALGGWGEMLTIVGRHAESKSATSAGLETADDGSLSF